MFPTPQTYWWKNPFGIKGRPSTWDKILDWLEIKRKPKVIVPSTMYENYDRYGYRF